MKKIMWLLMSLMLVSTVFAAQHRDPAEVQGMNNVMVEFQYQEQRESMEMSMSKLQTQQRERLNMLNDAIAIDQPDGSVLIEGTDEAKLFGIFKMQKKYVYKVGFTGDLEYKPRWYDFMWSGKKE